MTSKKNPIVDTRAGVVLYVLTIICVEFEYCVVTNPGAVSTGVARMQGLAGIAEPKVMV